MNQPIHGTLSPRLREAGFELTEDDHIIELRNGNELVARFNATRTTPEEIYKEADEWLKIHKTK